MIDVGTKIGRYEIRSLIGAGGMGEVYLAQDTRLQRKVALKILPVDLSSNPDRMRRFEQEATAAAALNHSNIAHIYEIGAHERVHFIAMEYIDGQTLRQVIHNGETELPKLLRYLQHVAEGLSKAHRAGIVHRDLKPDNIMVTRDGHAKILDFGLAKLLEPQPLSGSNNSEIATAILQQQSTPGTVMGTVGYMSPEQAKGKTTSIDQRSDVFSFGCILYEAITRRKAFEGKDPIDSLNKIIREQPAPITEFNPQAPHDLQKIVRRCLEKDPDERYHSIKDVAIEIRDVRRELADRAGFESTVPPSVRRETSQPSGEAISSPAGAAITSTPPNLLSTTLNSAEHIISGIRSHKAATALILAVFIVAVIAIGYGIYRFASQNKTTISFQSAKIMRLTTSGKASAVAISPDGKYVVHVHNEGGSVQSLWTRQVATHSNVQIIPPAPFIYNTLTFSPDGNYIYYTVESQELPQGALFKVPTLGGAPIKVLDNIARDTISFSPDGNQFTYKRVTPGKEAWLMIANVDGTGERKLVTVKNPPETIRSPAWSPDGKVIAYALFNYQSNNETLYEASVADGSTKPLTTHRWLRTTALAWLSDGSALLLLATPGQNFVYQIWQVSYPDGEARRVTNDLNDYNGMSLTADSNTLAVVKSDFQANIWIAQPMGGASRARPVTSGSGKADLNLACAPDGTIVYSSNVRGNEDIWIVNGDGSNQKQLTSNARVNRNPAVSPDGRYIVFMSDRTGIPHLWRMNMDGSDQRQLTNGNGEQNPQFSPDGRWLFYNTSFGRRTMWRMLAEGGAPVQFTDKNGGMPTVSPDGKLVGHWYEDENLRWWIGVGPIEGGELLKTFDVPTSSGDALHWSPDGRSLAYIDTKNGVSNIFTQPLDGSAPKQLTSFTSDRIFWFAFSRDGKQIALSRGTQTSDVVLIKDFR